MTSRRTSYLLFSNTVASSMPILYASYGPSNSKDSVSRSSLGHLTNPFFRAFMAGRKEVAAIVIAAAVTVTVAIVAMMLVREMS